MEVIKSNEDEFVVDIGIECIHSECPYNVCMYHWNALSEEDAFQFSEEHPDIAEILPMSLEEVESCVLYMDI